MSVKCEHCGTAFVPIGKEERFCCSGCAHVHSVIQTSGLGRFYDLRGESVTPVRPATLQPRDFTWLSEASKEAEKAGGRAELLLDIQGLSCAGCIWLIESLFNKKQGALRAEVNLQLGRLWMQWQSGQFDAKAFAEELQNFGYLVGPVGENSRSESKGLLLRVGLCAAFAMNTMFFTLPAYLGMEKSFALAGLFDLLTAVFATLSFLVGGTYFIKKAWLAWQEGLMPLDLPIALGVTGAYIGSLAGWWLGDARFLYFDFVSIFMFLMLGGRWVQERAHERNRNRVLRASPLWSALPSYDTTADGSFSPKGKINPRTVTQGAVFGVPAGEVCPVQARLVNGPAQISLEWINGESEARVWERGRILPAGAVNVGTGELIVRAEQAWGESLLSKLLAEAKSKSSDDGTGNVLRIYLTIVMALTLMALLLWGVLGKDWISGAQAALSMLVVSCPCALGVAIPLATDMAVARMRRWGLFVRDSKLWTKLPGIRHLVFDKTGTLTLEAPQLVNKAALNALSLEARDALWAMVHANLHPAARGLREALQDKWPELGALSTNESVKEYVGCGLSLDRDGARWTIGKQGWVLGPFSASAKGIESTLHTDRHDMELRRDGVVVAQFNLLETIRPQAKEEVAYWRKRGYGLFILSGDRNEKVAKMLSQLGLPKESGLGELTPQQKADWLEQSAKGKTLYVGDGANDALAFDAAYCRGTPVADRGLLENKADFYFLSRNLSPLRMLMETAALRKRALRVVFGFAITYNLCAATACLLGFMSPLLAAILMPLSSVVTIGLVGAQMAERR